MEDQSQNIPIGLLLEPRQILRWVNKESVEFLELTDSIRKHGFINSICVRPAREPDRYEIIDGLYRYTAARQINLPAVPCIVKHNVNDDDVLVLQLAANAIRPETKPIEFAEQIKKLLTRRPDMSMAELACLINKSPNWVRERLGLLRLLRNVQPMVDRGEIPLASAYMLAKIPHSLQGRYVEQARKMQVPQFKALAASVVKQYQEAVKQGKMDRFYSASFQAQPHLRNFPLILAEIKQREIGALLVTSEGCKNALDGFYAALKWAVHLDRNSVAEQEAMARAKEERTVLDAPLE